MPRKRERVSSLMAAVTVFVLAAFLLSWTPFRSQRYEVAVPPLTASPEQVTLAYMKALDAYDTETAYALSTREHRPQTESWLTSTSKITNIRLSGVTKDTTYVRSENGGSRGLPAIRVLTRFTYEGADDPSFPNGEQVWDYILTKDPRSGRWLVNDEGLM